MHIIEFITNMGILLYGKDRFFRQENKMWYDREYDDYISTEDVLKRIYDQCYEEMNW